jgi:hypothetical protein
VRLGVVDVGGVFSSGLGCQHRVEHDNGDGH